MGKKDLLSLLLGEAQNYSTFDDFEKLVEKSDDLSMIPVQPLFVAMQKATTDQIADVLPKLSSEQRQVLLDLDLWQKDEVDLKQFSRWPEIYARCKDLEVTQEFSQTNEFMLFLKSSFTIYTFDEEDPQYPNHDNFFITDDNLLLFEYDDNVNAKEVQFIVKNLYAALGVEKAYTLLFKNVVDSYYSFQEDAYQEKRERLRDYGFVDYYDALTLRRALKSKKSVDDFIKKQSSRSGSLSALSSGQSLHSQSVIPFQEGMESLHEELSKIQDEKRFAFLHFDFIRLVNAQFSLHEVTKDGHVAQGRIGRITKKTLLLGLSYTQKFLDKESILFEKFSFWDLFLVGSSLIDIAQKRIKKALDAFDKHDDFEQFLGARLNKFADLALEDFPKVLIDGTPVDLIELALLQEWEKQVVFFENILPFIAQFYTSYKKLNDESLLSDDFYLNYQVADIDFEAILSSSLINFELGHFQKAESKKMGVFVSELLEFVGKYMESDSTNSTLVVDKLLEKTIKNFQATFGLDSLGTTFFTYFVAILKEQLEGYEFSRLKEQDFQHVGGPILLASSFESRIEK